MDLGCGFLHAGCRGTLRWKSFHWEEAEPKFVFSHPKLECRDTTRHDEHITVCKTNRGVHCGVEVYVRNESIVFSVCVVIQG